MQGQSRHRRIQMVYGFLAFFRLAVRRGFEPRLKAPKTSVLPLHHRTRTPLNREKANEFKLCNLDILLSETATTCKPMKRFAGNTFTAARSPSSISRQT